MEHWTGCQVCCRLHHYRRVRQIDVGLFITAAAAAGGHKSRQRGTRPEIKKFSTFHCLHFDDPSGVFSLTLAGLRRWTTL